METGMGQGQSISTVLEEMKMLDSLDKGFKSALLNIFNKLKETVSKG